MQTRFGFILLLFAFGTLLPQPSPAALFSPATTTNFLGLLKSGATVPPGTDGAVGPNHVMTALNSQVLIQDRSGNFLSTNTLAGWWAPKVLDPGVMPFDPHLVFDPSIQRFIFTAAAYPQSANSAILIAVSRTGDPTGAWNAFEVNADDSGVSWADYPNAGFNTNWIVVSANMYPVSGGSTNGVNLYVFSKADLASGTPSGDFTILSEDSGFGFSMIPAVTLDTNVATEYLVEDWNDAGGQLRVSTITGSVLAPVLTAGTAFPATNSWAFTVAADNLPQTNTATHINAGDARVLDCVYRNGSLWAAQTAFVPAAAPTRTAAQWWQFTPAGAVQQFGRVEDAANVTDYAYPSLAVNSRNDVLLGYSSFSTNQFASAEYAARFNDDLPGTLRHAAVLKAGQAAYAVLNGSYNPWGNYSATMTDPDSDSSFWTLQEYAASPANTWGTWWGRVDLKATLNFSKGGTGLVLTWPGTSVLQRATNVGGPYGDVAGAASPFTNSSGSRYFRLKN